MSILEFQDSGRSRGNEGLMIVGHGIAEVFVR